jgi:PHD/YefM family antitoxin component YafN of YafNO toxin-antitoxin module
MSTIDTTKNFQQNLSYFFDRAKDEPIAINRGTDRYVLLHENEFNKLKDQVMYLQKSLLAVFEDMDAGGPTEMGDIDKFHKELMAEIEKEEQ